jgi:hypothetical protein
MKFILGINLSSLILATLLLTNCGVFDSEEEPSHPSTQPKISITDLKTQPHSLKEKDHSTQRDECCSPEKKTAQDPSSFPKEGDIVIAGEKLMELRKNNPQKKLSHKEMSYWLQKEMDISPQQANDLLEALDIE